MRITVIGSGYLGLVSDAGLADLGNDVLCLDADLEKIAVLNSGGVAIFDGRNLFEPVGVKSLGIEYYGDWAMQDAGCRMQDGKIVANQDFEINSGT